MAEQRTLLSASDKLLYNTGLEQGAKELEKAGDASLYSGIAGIGSSTIDYSLASIKASFIKTQAEYVELQSSEQMNILMEQFNNTVGQVQYTAARRNVKIGEGSTAQNLEKSSMNIGEDIALNKKNAASKARMLRNQAKSTKSMSYANLLGGLTKSAMSFESADTSYSLADSARSKKLK